MSAITVGGMAVIAVVVIVWAITADPIKRDLIVRGWKALCSRGLKKKQ